MNIAELFIRRPVMTTLVMAAILLFGIMGYRQLPVSDLPNVDFPTIVVSASLPGATPETMASSVALPLEKQFSTIAGVDNMTSASAQGVSSITLQFALDRNIDAAAQDVQSMISKAGRDLPQNLPSPPSYQKVNPADAPILYIALSSPTLPLSTVDEYAETMMAQRISMVSGVAQVQVYGSQKYAVRVQLDPKQLATRQIGVNDVEQAVENGNVNLPTGILYGSQDAFTVQANGQLVSAEDYLPLIVAYRNGSPVRIKDIGTAIDSVENNKIASWFNGTRAIVLAIQRQPGTNTIEVVNSIKALLPNFRAQMPASVNLNILYDRSVSIRESVRDVKFTLMLTVVLVILVIFLFLRNVSATIIPSLALPMSIVGTFAVMYLLGYSVDNLSLMALTLSVGFVVDDAIVMLENIVRHGEGGEETLTAALRGSREIGFTILSMTLSLAAVFLPVLFMGGILGRLLHEFAVTISAAILVSGVVSLTLTPMLCSRFLRPAAEQRHGKLYKISERGFDAMKGLYERTLTPVMHHRVLTMVVLVALMAGTAYLFLITPAGFLPSEDNGSVFMFTEGKQGISFEAMKAHQQKLAAIVMSDPYVDNVMSSVGAGGPNATLNTGRVFIRLKPRATRPHVDAVIQELRPKLTGIPGMRAFMQNMPPIRIGGQLTKSQYQFTLQSPDTAELYQHAPRFEARLRGMKELQDVTSDLLITNPQVNVLINRDKAAMLGVTAGQVEDALYTAYGNRQISTIYAPNNEYRVIMELRPEYQMEPGQIPLLYIRSANAVVYSSGGQSMLGGGPLVPLEAVATLTRNIGPMTINHLGQLPAVTVSFNLPPGVALGQAVDAVSNVARQTLPATITTSFQGTAQAFQSSFRGLGWLLVMAILVIYIVLGILYESFIHPLTILSGLPAAGFGALLTLWIFRQPFWPLEWRVTDLNIYGFVGLIMLVGIVKKNAIMMIDFALEAQRKGGKDAHHAIYEGALIRFRPIMMTTMAALMGTLPIALGFGAGSESRRPLGLAVVGGLVVSQLLTLYITPVFYTYMEQVQDWIRRHQRRKRLPAPIPARVEPELVEDQELVEAHK